MSKKQASMAVSAERPGGISRSSFILAMVIVAVVGFVAGTRQQEIYSTVGSVFGVRISTDTIDTSSLQDTFRRLQENYDGQLDVPSLIEGANRGLVEAVGDVHTTYMSAEESSQFDRDLSGNIGGGIGAEIGVRNDQPTILRTLEGTPAEKSGLKSGDIIVSVNDTETNGWTADKTAQAIRGEIGTTVKIVVFRDGKEQEFNITRAEITNPSVDSEIKDGLGIMTIRRFDGETTTLTKKVAENFKQQKVRGVVVDLRGNGGGYLSAAQDVAGLWLDDKVIVSERRGDDEQETLRSRSNPILKGIPTVVLVDEASASASEIVAGALQDYEVAEIIGKTTFGKGTVQKLVSLRGGAKLKVTIARWYTPEGRNITKEGIKPDKEVDISAEEINAGKDPQMDAAIRAFGD